MTEIISKAKPYQHWLMLIPLALSGVWFSLLEQKVLTPEYLLHIRLDDYIPFTPLFVIPYVLWYFYVAATAVFLFFRSPMDFARMAIFLALGMMIACTVYTLFPNGQALRPMLRGYEEPLVRLIRLIYASDTPANSAPSIHVIYSVAAHAAIAHYNSRRKIPLVNGASFILAGLCILSTVFIKQHSVIDLMAGLLLSALLYFIIYGHERMESKNSIGRVGAVQ